MNINKITTMAANTLDTTKKAVTSNGPKLKPQLTKDTLELSNLVKNRHIEAAAEKLKDLSSTDIARHFKKNVMDGVEDWTDAFPKNGEKGSELVRGKFGQYIQPLKDMEPKEVEHFFKCIMGTNKAGVLRESAQNNADIQKFVDVLESKIGKSIEEFVNS